MGKIIKIQNIITGKNIFIFIIIFCILPTIKSSGYIGQHTTFYTFYQSIIQESELYKDTAQICHINNLNAFVENVAWEYFETIHEST